MADSVLGEASRLILFGEEFEETGGGKRRKKRHKENPKMLRECEERRLASAWSHGAVGPRCRGLEGQKSRTGEPGLHTLQKPSFILSALNIPEHNQIQKVWPGRLLTILEL